MQRILIGIVEYALGFLALALFGAYALASGTPTPQRWIAAFKIASCVAIAELVVLAARRSPANRLIIGANLWLLIGGTAAFLEQWWVLQAYERFGEASLFVAILLVGLFTTLVSRAGFVAAEGERQRVLLASGAMLLAVIGALVVAVVYRGNIKLAAVFPVIGLSWLNRALRAVVSRVV
ncbi:hypothetical protein [Caldimonas brevitalea]|uniref:Uncharacterized protein n=1 Tax=Caldimonas brevitalea TaxID=413882 RepID=A0A0G3BID0_9BURK|nr:hypothetical protein [Caldimonas brevitalea]AKJ27131.1 hypothetical protein AAW51_0440 [Caldimonas brevitalea]